MSDGGLGLLTQLPASKLPSIFLALPPMLSHKALLALSSTAAVETLSAMPVDEATTFLSYMTLPQAHALLQVHLSPVNYSGC